MPARRRARESGAAELQTLGVDPASIRDALEEERDR
jgi:hypothetical protein